MTTEDLQEIVAAVIAALKTNGKTIDQLTAVTSLADSDNLEVSGGKKIAFSKLKELVASDVVVTEESIKGWVPIESTEDLPEEPTPEEQEKAYIIAEDSMLYVYVGEGGDTLDGLYQSVELQGPQGETGPAGADGHDGVDLGEVALINDLTTGGEGNALSAEMGKVLGDEVFGKPGKVSPNTAIASITGYNSLTYYQANNFTVDGLVAGININLRTSTTLEVVVYDVVAKEVVSTIKTETFSSGGIKSITFATPVELGANQFIACKPSSAAIYINSASGVGYYYNGTYVADKELSFELVTISRGLQTKVANLESATAIVPTLKDDVLGRGVVYVSPNHDITTSTSSGFQSNAYIANRLYTNGKILGVRAYCTGTGTLDIGLYDIFANSVADVQQVSVTAGLNTITLDTPIYLAPNQFVAVKSSAYFLGFWSTGGVGTLSLTGQSASYEIAYDLIVEDNGLMGDVAALQVINTRKRWCSIGTSITYYNDHFLNERFARGYQSRVMDKISFSQFTNVGVAGQAIATGAKSGSVPCLAAQVDSVLTAVADFYTIEHGINDWNRCATIGTIDDFINNTGYSTFYGAWRIVIDKIYTLNPNAKIILITPRKAYGASVFPDHWWEANTAGGNDYYLKDYVAAVRAIGEFLSLPVCDWSADSNTNQYNLAADSVDVALHPNDVGYQKLANLLIETFKKVID